MKKIAMAGVALGVLATGTAQAQVQTPGFFGNIDGFYSLQSGNLPGGISTGFPVGIQATARDFGDGFGGRTRVGYQFGALWDIALGFQYTDWGKGDSNTSAGGAFVNRLTDGKLWAVDLESGYTISGPGYGVRPFAGIRYFQAKYDGQNNLGVVNSYEGKTWGVGPRIGADATVSLFGPVSMFGGVDFAALFGKVKTDNNNAVVGNSNSSRTMWNFNGRVGLDWEIAPLVHLAVGFQLDYWQGIQHNRLFTPFAVGGDPSGRSDRINYGPFIRFAYNWGAGPSVAPPAPVPGVESFMVFFDFDRANLTPTALTTIKQAAAQAKAGNKTRIGVTGHTDRAGSDSYNMALSLRRANAVKDQLVREGIAANQIVVVGKGESEPLVPTADGVREPQNRRVVIVLS